MGSLLRIRLPFRLLLLTGSFLWGLFSSRFGRSRCSGKLQDLFVLCQGELLYSQLQIHQRFVCIHLLQAAILTEDVIYIKIMIMTRFNDCL